MHYLLTYNYFTLFLIQAGPLPDTDIYAPL